MTMNDMTMNLSNNKGFTIVELLVSIAIFSIIFGAMMLAFSQQQRQFTFTQEAVNVDQLGRNALDLIATEIRNAGARQSKNNSIRFVNGGSPDCNGVTDQDGSILSPPDCIEIYTWDKTRGFSLNADDSEDFPSVAADITVVTTDSPLRITIPQRWFDKTLIQSDETNLIGFWSRIVLCDPTGLITCSDDPVQCANCGAILKVDNIINTNTLEFNDINSIIEQNFKAKVEDFADLDDFISNFFIPRISSLSSEMTIVKYRRFSVDTANLELLMATDPSTPVSSFAIAGGANSPGIVDMQFVFNLQDTDGSTTKIGVPNDLSSPPKAFTDFTDPTLADSSAQGSGLNISRIKDTKTVQIYLVVRSRLKPQLMSGSFPPPKNLPEIGDRLLIRTDDPSLGEGFIYKVFTTTVYMRNLSREDIG